MAYKPVFLVLVVAVALPVFVSAKDFVVGDDKGWTNNFDYSKWTLGKQFYVGDRLVFKYPAGAHNVFKVNGTSFQNCTKPPLVEALRSGNDTITLATPGRKWYICGVAQHCATGGQKLFLVVNPVAMSPSIAPSQNFGSPAQAITTSSANGIIFTAFQSAMTMALAILFVIVI